MTADAWAYTLVHDSHGRSPHFIERALGGSAAGAAKGVRFNQTTLAIDAALSGQGIALASGTSSIATSSAGRLVDPFDAKLDSDAGHVVAARRPRHQAQTAAVRAWLLSHRRGPRVYGAKRVWSVTSVR